MSFVVITDSACNLRHDYLQAHNVPVIPYSYFINGEEHTCLGPEEFDGDAYYQMLSDGGIVKTTLINSQSYDDFFRPHLEAGNDLLYVGMSSGISSSMNMATLAARELLEEFPDRKLVIFDARTASLGEAIFVRAAIRRRDEGLSHQPCGYDGAAHRAAQPRMLLSDGGRPDVPQPRRARIWSRRHHRHRARRQASAARGGRADRGLRQDPRAQKGAARAGR